MRFIRRNSSRLRFGLFSAFLFAGFTALFYRSFYFGFEYTSQLVIWFFLWLSFFHAVFAFNFGLTATGIRKIDYWYLGVAAIGVLFFAISYADQRTEYLGQLGSARLKEMLRVRGQNWLRQWLPTRSTLATRKQNLEISIVL
jgi:hypothetical protein